MGDNVCENRKARFNYHIQETLEAGLVLQGTEVKSCRTGKASLAEAYAALRGGELYLQNAHINEYSHGNRENHDPKRIRKLLLHKKEIQTLIGQMAHGFSLIPLKMYFKKNKIKVLLGLGKGKKAYDKREALKKKQDQREMKRALKYRK